MNRVVLCGRLAERPRISATASGLPLATLRLQVPRQGLAERPQAIDEIECLAFDDLARQLHLRGVPGLQVNLEGWLLSGWCRGEDNALLRLARVAIEAAYWLDPRETAPERVEARLLSPHPEPTDLERGSPRSRPSPDLPPVGQEIPDLGRYPPDGP